MAPTNPPTFIGNMKRRFRLIIIIAVVVGVIYLGFTFWGGSISDGHRDGYIQKVSFKGRAWKTWECEAALPGYNRAAQGAGQPGGNVWAFTCEDERVAKDLEKVDGEMLVRLYYKEYAYTTWWSGETNYRVYKFDLLRKVPQVPQSETK